MTKDTQPKPTAWALSAAERIGPDSPISFNGDNWPECQEGMAHIIDEAYRDRETGVTELLDTLKDAPDSPAPQGFDVKGESPHKFAKRMHTFLVKYLTWQSSRKQAIARCESGMGSE